MATVFKEKTISANEQRFVLEALAEDIRVDGRGMTTHRRTQVVFEDTWGVARVNLGNTQVVCTVSSEIVEPSPDHGNEGHLVFNVQFPTLASPYFTGQKTPQTTEISRTIERCIKDTHCVDAETLCIVAKERVWSILLDIRIINYDGNVVDACTLAALAALMYYRRPDVTVTNSGVTIHNELEKNFLPLRLGCIPITTTFALFNRPGVGDTSDPYVAVDPSLTEDLTADGMMTIATTPDQEVLCISSTGSSGYESELILQNSILAVEHARNIYTHLKSQLDEALGKKKHKIW